MSALRSNFANQNCAPAAYGTCFCWSGETVSDYEGCTYSVLASAPSARNARQLSCCIFSLGPLSCYNELKVLGQRGPGLATLIKLWVYTFSKCMKSEREPANMYLLTTCFLVLQSMHLVCLLHVVARTCIAHVIADLCRFCANSCNSPPIPILRQSCQTCHLMQNNLACLVLDMQDGS